jgi:hypothetical protein
MGRGGNLGPEDFPGARFLKALVIARLKVLVKKVIQKI